MCYETYLTPYKDGVNKLFTQMLLLILWNLLFSYLLVLLLQDMAADGELLLISISPDKDGKFGFNVKVSEFCYYVCFY